jgi:hypothetical protein
VQLDLFGEVAAQESEADRRRRERDEWAAKFERADWIAPYDTGGGMKKGEAKPGWRCPDPACGQIEPNAYLLRINHGYDPDVPGCEPWGDACARLTRLESQRQAEEQRIARYGQ